MWPAQRTARLATMTSVFSVFKDSCTIKEHVLPLVLKASLLKKAHVCDALSIVSIVPQRPLALSARLATSRQQLVSALLTALIQLSSQMQPKAATIIVHLIVSPVLDQTRVNVYLVLQVHICKRDSVSPHVRLVFINQLVNASRVQLNATVALIIKVVLPVVKAITSSFLGIVILWEAA